MDETAFEEARRLAPDLGVSEATLRRHLELLPDVYGHAVAARAIVRHAAAAGTPLADGELRTRITPGGDDVDHLDVIAHHRHDLLALVSGVIAIHGGSVLSGRTFLREDGIAVDTFSVRVPPGSRGPWWAAVEGDLDEAAAARLALRARVHRLSRRPPPPGAAVVEVGASPDGAATLLRIAAPDRVGLLYELAAALAELRLDVLVAADTIGDEAIDAFTITREGRALDRDLADEAVLAVRDAIAG